MDILDYCTTLWMKTTLTLFTSGKCGLRTSLRFLCVKDRTGRDGVGWVGLGQNAGWCIYKGKDQTP